MPYEILLQHVSIVPCLCVFGISHFGLYYLYSSTNLDALEMEMKPQEGSQYWVCPIIVEYMNDRFDKKLLQYIQDNEGNGMQFMAEYYAD